MHRWTETIITMRRLSVYLIPVLCILTANCSSGALLEVIQASAPVRQSYESPACRQTIVSHDFGNSYGAPFVGTYSQPPKSCRFTTTVFNLSVSSSGRQYDRLAFLYFDDVEV